MKKRFRNILAVILAFVMVMGGFVPMTPNNPLTIAEAATKLRLNKSKITLEVGDWYEETYQLKIVGATKKVKWSTGNKSIAIVNQKGKVTAKKIGRTTITAKVNGKKLRCTVTVIKERSQSDIIDDINYNNSPYDKLYNAIVNDGEQNLEGDYFITYEDKDASGCEYTASIVYENKQFKFIGLIDDFDESTSVVMCLNRNGSESTSINCVSLLDLGDGEESYNMTAYFDLADYTKYTELNFNVNYSTNGSVPFYEKMANTITRLFMTEWDLCLIENGVGITMKDLGFINY